MPDTTIDSTRFNELRNTTGAEFVVELVDAFLEEAPAMLSGLRASREAGNAEAFRRAAHSLKSNSNTFGALKLGAMARELELAGLDKVRAMQPDPLAALGEEYQRVAAALKALCHA